MNRSVTWMSAFRVWLFALGAYVVIAALSLLTLSLVGVIGGGVLGAFSGSPAVQNVVNEISVEKAGVFGHYIGMAILLLGSFAALKFALDRARIEPKSK
jgi:hypothetical protein